MTTCPSHPQFGIRNHGARWRGQPNSPDCDFLSRKPIFKPLAVATGAIMISAVPSLASLLLIDDFSSGGLSAWTAMGGSWSASDGVAVQSAIDTYSNTSRILRLNMPMGNVFTFQVDVRTPYSPSQSDYGNDAIGVAFGMQDSANYYFAHFFPGYPGGAIRIGAVVNGTQSFLSGFGGEDHSLGFTPFMDQFHTVRVDGNGSTYTVQVWDGVDTNQIPFSHTFTDATFSGTDVGLWNAKGPGSFDNAFTSVPEP